jgi:hypothetical protein
MDDDELGGLQMQSALSIFSSIDIKNHNQD